MLRLQNAEDFIGARAQAIGQLSLNLILDMKISVHLQNVY